MHILSKHHWNQWKLKEITAETGGVPPPEARIPCKCSRLRVNNNNKKILKSPVFLQYFSVWHHYMAYLAIKSLKKVRIFFCEISSLTLNVLVATYVVLEGWGTLTHRHVTQKSCRPPNLVFSSRRRLALFIEPLFVHFLHTLPILRSKNASNFGGTKNARFDRVRFRTLIRSRGHPLEAAKKLSSDKCSMMEGQLG